MGNNYICSDVDISCPKEDTSRIIGVAIDRQGLDLINGMKIAGIENESIFANEVSIDDSIHEESLGGPGRSARV
jgi:hypothetical protein